MPSTRISVCSNSNRSLVAPLLLPDSAPLSPESSTSAAAQVYKLAKSKFRLKKPNRIFDARSGRELLNEEDWKFLLTSNPGKEIKVLVSQGEDFVGKKAPIPSQDGEFPAGDRSSLSVGDWKPTFSPLFPDPLPPDSSLVIDTLSLTQLHTTASTLPGIIHSVAQPDLHPGTKHPIGAVFASQGWIHPPLIGTDIGCGMAWYRTNISRDKVESAKSGERIAERLRGIEGEWRSGQERNLWLSASSKGSSVNGQEFSAGSFDRQLGTIGAGNHFAELQVVEYLSPLAASSDAKDHLRENEVLLLVHSGSRGYGADVLKRHTSESNSSLYFTDSKAEQYLSEHDRACGWADRNRDLIALRVLACIEPGAEEWEMGINEVSSGKSEALISAAYSAIQERKVVQICHNCMERVDWPPADPQAAPLAKHERKEPVPVFIHRKGAAPVSPFRGALPLTSSSSPNNTLLPLLPLPGSRGTPTLIIQPLISAANGFGAFNALSLAHGAGRALSRAKAAASVSKRWKGREADLLRGDVEDTSHLPSRLSGGSSGSEPWGVDDGFPRSEEDVGRKVRGGTWVVCEDKELIWEEAPDAYKDIWAVGAALAGSGVARRIGWCRGRISYKVRKE